MLPPLRTLMVALWILCLAGAVLVVLMSIGEVTWISFAISGVLGVILGVPAGLWTAHAIKRDDPNWPPRRRAFWHR